MIFGPGTSTRNICTSPRPRSSSSKTSFSCASAGTSAWKRSIGGLDQVLGAMPSVYQGIGLRSRKKPPVGPSSGSVASQTAVSAPSSTERGAPRAAHVGPHPARAHRVDLDPSPLVRRRGCG